MAPASGKVYDTFGENAFTNAYYRWYTDSRTQLAAWHRKQLNRLDLDFRLREAGISLVQAREKAREAGISPDDEQYPDLFNFLPIHTK